jgi:hypothetical protein
MNRWRARLAEIRHVGETAPEPVQIVQNVQNPPAAGAFEQIEQFEQHLISRKIGATGRTALAEPADPIALALQEPVPAWRAGIARLDPTRAISHPTRQAWETFLADCRSFVAGKWADQAARLGWDARQLFGCHRDRPSVCNWWGELLFIQGSEILGMTEAIIRLETRRGVRQSLRKMDHPYDIIVPVWDIRV